MKRSRADDSKATEEVQYPENPKTYRRPGRDNVQSNDTNDSYIHINHEMTHLPPGSSVGIFHHWGSERLVTRRLFSASNLCSVLITTWWKEDINGVLYPYNKSMILLRDIQPNAGCSNDFWLSSHTYELWLETLRRDWQEEFQNLSRYTLFHRSENRSLSEIAWHHEAWICAVESQFRSAQQDTMYLDIREKVCFFHAI